MFQLKIPHRATPVMERILNFHEKCLFVIVFVLAVVFIILFMKFFNLKRGVHNLENANFEIAWTVVPTLIILCLMVPSLEVLYFSEETGGVSYFKKVKVVAHQ
jgi:heme/copper-type cytochrome/quinol oxidase subunit 2